MNNASVLGHVDVDFSSNSSMGMTPPLSPLSRGQSSTFEPPLKKRRRHIQMMNAQTEISKDDTPSVDINDSKAQNHFDSNKIEKPTSSIGSLDLWQEYGSVDSRRSELRALYSSYMRLKDLLNSNNSNSSETSLANEIQEAIFSMVDSSRGYPLVRRIMAEILPKYLLRCPAGSLQIGTRALLQICDSACNELQKNENSDKVNVFDATARAIIQILPQILSSAVNSSNSKSASPMSCASVAREITLYLLSQLQSDSLSTFTSNFISFFLKPCPPPAFDCDQSSNAERHLHENSNANSNHSYGDGDKVVLNEETVGVKRQREEGEDKPNMDSSLPIPDLISKALSNSLKLQPEAVLGTCLEALRSGDTQRRKDGLEFLQHVLHADIPLSHESPSHIPPSKSVRNENENDIDSPSMEKDSSSPPDALVVSENRESLQRKEASRKETVSSKSDRELVNDEEKAYVSLAFEVLKDRHDAYKWVLTAIQQVRRNTVHDIQAQVYPMLQSLLNSLRTLKHFSSEPIEEVIPIEITRFRSWESRNASSSTSSANRNHSPKNAPPPPPPRVIPMFSKEREGSVEAGREGLSRSRQGWGSSKASDAQEEGVKERGWGLGLQKMNGVSPLPSNSLHQQHLLLQQQQKQLQLQIQQLQQKQQQALLLQQQQQVQKVSPTQLKKQNISISSQELTLTSPSSKSPSESAFMADHSKSNHLPLIDTQEQEDGDVGKENEKEEREEEKEKDMDLISGIETEDIFAASRNLRLIGFPEDVHEPQVRSELEKYGILESFFFLRGKDDAVFVSYKKLKDALKAKESLHGAVLFDSKISSYFAEGNDSSCEFYAWVGGVAGMEGKEEIMSMFETSSLPEPRSVAVLVSAGAMLLEFSSSDELNFVIHRLRETRRLKENLKRSSPSHRTKAPGSGIEPTSSMTPSTNSHHNAKGSEKGNGSVSVLPSRHLWVGRIDPMVREEEILAAFALYGDLDGWKFMRHSGCCFIDFLSPESASMAKSRLNNVRFGSQSIHVDFKNNPPHSSSRAPSSPSPSALPASNYSSTSLGTRLLSISQSLNNFGAKSALNVLNGPRSRSSRPLGGREVGDRERVPTNTLWMGLTDSVGNGVANLSELELKAIFNGAAGGSGNVVRIRSTRTSRGPCRFIEFDRVEAASSALRNVIQTSTFDSSVQIEFSNSALSLQQTESPSSKLTLEDIRRRSHDYQKEREYSRYSLSSIPPRYSRESIWESERGENENASSHPTPNPSFINQSEPSTPNPKPTFGNEENEEASSILGKPPCSDELTAGMSSHAGYRRISSRPTDTAAAKGEGKFFRRMGYEEAGASWKDGAHGGRTGLKYGFRDIASLTGNAPALKSLDYKNSRVEREIVVETRGIERGNLSSSQLGESRVWSLKQEDVNMEIDDMMQRDSYHSDGYVSEKDKNQKDKIQSGEGKLQSRREMGVSDANSFERENANETKEEKDKDNSPQSKHEQVYEGEDRKNEVVAINSSRVNSASVTDRSTHPIATPGTMTVPSSTPNYAFIHRTFSDRHVAHAPDPPSRHPLPSPRIPLAPLPFTKTPHVNEQTDTPSILAPAQTSSRALYPSSTSSSSSSSSSTSHVLVSENQKPSTSIPLHQDIVHYPSRASERTNELAGGGVDASFPSLPRHSSSLHLPSSDPSPPLRTSEAPSPKHVLPSSIASSPPDSSIPWDGRGGKEKYRPHLRKQNSSNASHWLCKSGISYCEVNVIRLEASSCAYEGYFREPSGWPSKLDVTKRADYKSLQSSFHSFNHSQREICRLSASPGEENTSGFHKFVEYLKEKDRAGVIKVPPAKGLWARMLYVMPWSKHICELLGVVPDLKHRNTLFALVLPANPSASS